MISIGSDHAGYHLKKELMQALDRRGIAYQDEGTFTGEAVDYPQVAEKVANAVASGACEQGILVCGTGIGMSICANKVRGIRAAVCHDVFSARMTRMHNDANILCMGERVVGTGLALDVLDAWLGASFEGGRHQRRVDMIRSLDEAQP